MNLYDFITSFDAKMDGFESLYLSCMEAFAVGDEPMYETSLRISTQM
jgi:hypothetical protein